MRNILVTVAAQWRRIALGAVAVAGIVGLSAGSAAAAGMITTHDIKQQTIRSGDIHAQGVGTSEIRNGDVHWWDIREHAIGRGRLNQQVRDQLDKQAEQGPKGDRGPRGKVGPAGLDGVSGYEVVGRTADRTHVDAGETATVDTRCDSHGEVAISGGAKVVSGDATLGGSYPADVHLVAEPDEGDEAGRWAAEGWAVKVTAGESGASVQPYVLCAQMG